MDEACEHARAAVEYFSLDRFAMQTCGFNIAEAEPGRAVVQVDIEARHLNGKDGIQGGVLMTLVDFACAVADFDPAFENASIGTQVSFLTLARDAHLTCTATAERRGRTVGVYRAEIVDGTGTLVAVGSSTLMHKPR